MLPYLAVAASVFVIIKGLRYLIEAPGWFWFLLSAAFCVGGTWLATGEPWWGVAVTFATGIFFRFDSLLQALTDAARVVVIRNTTRR